MTGRIALVAVLLLAATNAGCGPTPPSVRTPASQTVAASAQSTASPVPTAIVFAGVDSLRCGYPAVSTAPSEAPAQPRALSGSLPHEAPDLEALLPADAGGGVRWSARGETLLELATALSHSAEVEAARRLFVQAGVDPEGFAFAMAGRSEPCAMLAVFALPSAVLPPAAYTETLNRLYDSLLRNIETLSDMSVHINQSFPTTRTLGGKRVRVGLPEWVATAAFGSARHYFYQKGPPRRELFVVLTDDEAWATDMIRQFE